MHSFRGAAPPPACRHHGQDLIWGGGCAPGLNEILYIECLAKKTYSVSCWRYLLYLYFYPNLLGGQTLGKFWGIVGVRLWK